MILFNLLDVVENSLIEVVSILHLVFDRESNLEKVKRGVRVGYRKNESELVDLLDDIKGQAPPPAPWLSN